MLVKIFKKSRFRSKFAKMSILVKVMENFLFYYIVKKISILLNRQ